MISTTLKAVTCVGDGLALVVRVLRPGVPSSESVRARIELVGQNIERTRFVFFILFFFSRAEFVFFSCQ